MSTFPMAIVRFRSFLSDTHMIQDYTADDKRLFMNSLLYGLVAVSIPAVFINLVSASWIGVPIMAVILIAERLRLGRFPRTFFVQIDPTRVYDDGTIEQVGGRGFRIRSTAISALSLALSWMLFSTTAAILLGSYSPVQPAIDEFLSAGLGIALHLAVLYCAAAFLIRALTELARALREVFIEWRSQHSG